MEQDNPDDGQQQALDQDSLRSIADELAAARHSATAGQGYISATVDGNGRLLDIEIDPYLDSGKRSRLSSILMEAITEARKAASARGMELLDQVGGRDSLAEKFAAASPWEGVANRSKEDMN